MSQIFKLYRLQQIDSQLDWTRNRLEEIEVLLADDRAIQKAQKKYDTTDQQLSISRKELRRAEEKVKAQQIKIEQTETALYSGKVRNPKELQDMELELAAHKRYLSVLEERQLKAMFTEEEALAINKTSSVELETLHEQFADQNEKLSKEKDRMLRDVTRYEEERLATAASIPEADMELYNALRMQRRGIAVAKISDKTCSACGTTLNATLLDAARSPSQINNCDTCGRILYAG